MTQYLRKVLTVLNTTGSNYFTSSGSFHTCQVNAHDFLSEHEIFD